MRDLPPHRFILPVVDEAVELRLGAELGGDVGPPPAAVAGVAVAATVEDERRVGRRRHRLGREVVVDVLCKSIYVAWSIWLDRTLRHFIRHDMRRACRSRQGKELGQANRTETDRRRRETIRFICIENAVQHCIKFFARRAADVGTVMYLVWAVLAHARSTASLSSGNFILMKTSYILQCW